MPKQISVSEAHDAMQQGGAYVDVRSTVEFAQGHPAGAVNVPLFEPDEVTGHMQPNPDFMRVMRATFPPDTRLLVGCQAGGRSMRAAQMLEGAGYHDVSNVRGGYGGARDPMSGRVFDPGWAEAGLPVEEGAPDGKRYDDLLDAADRQS
jgi:rhodanese-related sulfurtransferase